MRPALLLLAAVPLLAQPVIDDANPEGIVLAPNGKIRHVWNRKGIWRTGPSHPTLNALSALFQATPTGTALNGFWVKESRTISATAFSIGFFPFYLEEILVNGKWTPQFAGETESVYFDFNRLPGRLAQPVLAREANAEFYPRPKVTGQFNGFNVYDNDALLITRANRDPWAPVPLGRALKAAMPDYEKDRASAESRLANQKRQNDETQSPANEQKLRDNFEKNYGNLRASNPSRFQTRLDSLERELRYNRDLAAQRANPQRDKDGNWYWNPIDAHAKAAARLAALSPAEAASPACYLPAADKDGRYVAQGEFLPDTGNPQCLPLVTDNLNYFDKPRSVPQLLWVNAFGRCARLANGKLVLPYKPRTSHPPQGCQIHLRFWSELDWSRIAALLVP
jgi:hypothetical protein